MSLSIFCFVFNHRCQTPLKKDTDDIADSEEKGPDIIPANINNRQHFIVNGKFKTDLKFHIDYIWQPDDTNIKYNTQAHGVLKMIEKVPALMLQYICKIFIFLDHF